MVPLNVCSKKSRNAKISINIYTRIRDLYTSACVCFDDINMETYSAAPRSKHQQRDACRHIRTSRLTLSVARRLFFNE